MFNLTFPTSTHKFLCSTFIHSVRTYGNNTIIKDSVRRPKIVRKYAHETARRLKISKTLSWLLRHQGRFEGIDIRSDGYARVGDVLKHLSMRSVEFLDIEDVVKKDSKGRFTLTYEGDRPEGDHWWIRANQGHSMEACGLHFKPRFTHSPPANSQAADLELERVNSIERIPVALHGTTEEAWRHISQQGISRMDRNHIHLAQGFENGVGSQVFSGIRKSSRILIYIDVEKALADGIKFYLSTNGVVLCPGNEFGFLEPKYFQRVERVAKTLEPVHGWDGQLADSSIRDQPKAEV